MGTWLLLTVYCSLKLIAIAWHTTDDWTSWALFCHHLTHRISHIRETWQTHLGDMTMNSKSIFLICLNCGDDPFCRQPEATGHLLKCHDCRQCDKLSHLPSLYAFSAMIHCDNLAQIRWQTNILVCLFFSTLNATTAKIVIQQMIKRQKQKVWQNIKVTFYRQRDIQIIHHRVNIFLKFWVRDFSCEKGIIWYRKKYVLNKCHFNFNQIFWKLTIMYWNSPLGKLISNFKLSIKYKQTNNDISTCFCKVWMKLLERDKKNLLSTQVGKNYCIF